MFRGRAGTLIKALWQDGIGLSLYAKRLDRCRFIWPATVDGVVVLTAAQMGYLLEAIDWRNPQHSSRPQSGPPRRGLLRTRFCRAITGSFWREAVIGTPSL